MKFAGLALALWGATVGAQEAWLPKVAQKVAATPTWRLDLDWTVRPAGGIAAPTTTRGILRLGTGETFSFTAPGLRVLSDGKTAWQYTQSTGQVVVMDAKRLDASLRPGVLLQAALAGKEKSATPEALDGKATMRLDLDVSRPPLSRFASARLWVGKNSLKPLRLSVSDVQGGGHDWVLRKMQAWTPGPTDFVWKSPKGAEVVDTRP